MANINAYSGRRSKRRQYIVIRRENIKSSIICIGSLRRYSIAPNMPHSHTERCSLCSRRQLNEPNCRSSSYRLVALKLNIITSQVIHIYISPPNNRPNDISKWRWHRKEYPTAGDKNRFSPILNGGRVRERRGVRERIKKKKIIIINVISGVNSARLILHFRKEPARHLNTELMRGSAKKHT